MGVVRRVRGEYKLRMGDVASSAAAHSRSEEEEEAHDEGEDDAHGEDDEGDLERLEEEPDDERDSLRARVAAGQRANPRLSQGSQGGGRCTANAQRVERASFSVCSWPTKSCKAEASRLG